MSLAMALVACACFITIAPPACSQESDRDLIDRARSLATGNERVEALALLDKRLADYPNDTDARTLYGIILSWNGRYDDARKALESVLERSTTHGDALPALINVELWSDHPERAEALASQALHSRPNDTSLLMSRARALKALNRTGDAADVLDKLLEVDPTNQQAKQLRSDLTESLRDWETSIEQSYEWFSDNRSAWLETQLSLKRQTRIGPVFMRLSHAHRLSLDSNLMEIEAYPSLRRGPYAYLYAGWSPDGKLYSAYKLGAEIFQGLRYGFEVSGGIRHLGFKDKVNVYTASLSKYYGNWLFTTRTYVTPAAAGDAVSLQ